MNDAPNFRLTVRLGDDEPERTTLQTFLAENEAAPYVCDVVKMLEPGQHVTVNAITMTRAEKTSPRFTKIRVPIKFEKARFATVLIDRKRLTLAIRPAHRRVALELELGDWVERMLWKQAAVNAKKKGTRRTRRSS